MKHIIAVVVAGLLLAGPAQAGLIGLNTAHPNLQLWLRADLGVTTDAGGVTGWTDQSANGYTFDVLGGFGQPGLIASDPGANGMASIDFAAATGTYLKCDAAGIIPATGTVFNVISMVPVGGKVWATDVTVAGTRLRRELLLDSRTTAVRRPLNAYERLGSGNYYAKVGDVAADPNVLTGLFAISVLTTDVANDTTTLVLNGDPAFTGTTVARGAYGVAPLTLGGYPTGSSPYDGEMAEMIVFDRVLTGAEIDEVAGYLADRYDIAYIPEPATLSVLCLGALGIVRRKK